MMIYTVCDDIIYIMKQSDLCIHASINDLSACTFISHEAQSITMLCPFIGPSRHLASFIKKVSVYYCSLTCCGSS